MTDFEGPFSISSQLPQEEDSGSIPESSPEEKNEALDDLRPEPEEIQEKRKRKSSGPSKAELRERLAQLEGRGDSPLTAENCKAIAGGLLAVAEVLTGMAYSKVSDEQKNAFASGVDGAVRAYSGPVVGSKWGPLIILGTSFAFVSIEAFAKTDRRKKTEEKPLTSVSEVSNPETVMLS